MGAKKKDDKCFVLFCFVVRKVFVGLYSSCCSHTPTFEFWFEKFFSLCDDDGVCLLVTHW